MRRSLELEGVDTDLCDVEWQIMESIIPPAKSGGRRREVDVREIVNGVGATPGGTCLTLCYCDRPSMATSIVGARMATWETMNVQWREAVHMMAGCDAEPRAAILNGQSVKTTAVSSERGYDNAKKVMGHKRHILIDVMGLLLVALVHKADIWNGRGQIAPPAGQTQRLQSTGTHLSRWWLRRAAHD
ncbi:MAG: hypothetical protein R3A44_05765 [Caldilineaceae bacterium]